MQKKNLIVLFSRKSWRDRNNLDEGGIQVTKNVNLSWVLLIYVMLLAHLSNW